MIENLLINNDSKLYLPELESNLVDLIVTDPPYALNFMGKAWDKVLPSKEILKECLRVLKHGAFAFWLCSPRQDLLSKMIVLLDSVGFNVNFTSLYWSYASGFPKSQNISKAIDKKLGLERKKIKRIRFDGKKTGKIASGLNLSDSVDLEYSNIPNSSQAQEMEGSYGGFQPKPAVEVILVTMKPLSEKTYLEQALKDGKGVTWLDSGRIPTNDEINEEIRYSEKAFANINPVNNPRKWVNERIEKGLPVIHYIPNQNGRFPANLLVSDRILDTGKTYTSGKVNPYVNKSQSKIYGNGKGFSKKGIIKYGNFQANEGDFSRYFDLGQWFTKQIPFFIVPKPSKTEKNLGLEIKSNPKSNIYKWTEINELEEFSEDIGEAEEEKELNFHPTVKAIALFSYLISIGSRKNDLILDPFVGSGTTSISAEILGRKHIGIEKDPDYYKIAKNRLEPENIKALIDLLKDNLPKLPKIKETKPLNDFFK